MSKTNRDRTAEPVPAFAQAFERLRGEAAGSSGQALEQRAAAFARFKALGVPTPRIEHWKVYQCRRLCQQAVHLGPAW